MKHRLLSTFMYNLLVRLSWLQRRTYTARPWHMLFASSAKRFKGNVSTTIHGRKVEVNFGYPYPFIARTIRTFNNPLLELVYGRYKSAATPVNVVDVGASIGDTYLLISSNCPGMVENFYCIEGEEGFYRLLEQNMRQYNNVKTFRVMLSSKDGLGRKLVRIHGGTASGVGEGKTETITLDTLCAKENIKDIDILKIDVDGYDGKVLEGAKKFLGKNKADIIFEWHPLLCEKAGNSPHGHFETLSRMPYSSFLFFNKFGEFSHFMSDFDRGAVQQLAQYCVRERASDDWHYDVIALHKGSAIDPLSLASMNYARTKPSPF